MKHLFEFLFLIQIFFSFSLLHAQSENSFFVGSESLQNIEEQLFEVRFEGVRKGFNMAIYFGQDCADSFGQIGSVITRRLRQECVGLSDSERELIIFNHYMTGLNLLEKEGFELLEIVPNLDSHYLHNASFIFRRKPD